MESEVAAAAKPADSYMVWYDPQSAELIGRVTYKGLIAILEAISATSTQIIVQGLSDTLDSKDVKGALNSGILPYLYAAGLLSYAGRDIDKKSVSKVVASLGLKPQNDLIDIVLRTGVKGHLIYVYAFYFLIATGRQTTKENIKKVVEALGVKPDSEDIDYVLKYVAEYHANP